MGNAYGEFSRYYDLLGWNAFARSSAIRLKSFFKMRGRQPQTILDLACGTGELEKALGTTAIQFTGVDISPGMIKAARRKYPRGRFIVADAAAVRLRREYDIVLLLFDSANHMRSLAHLKQVFRNARRHLKPGGFLIFDFLTEYGLEEWEQIDIRRTKDYTLFWYGHYYPEKLLADIFIEAFIKETAAGRNSYHRIFQKIVEKTYPASDIIVSLSECGFSKIMASPYDLSEKIERASRLWFVCN
jgi:ubiquinone/menaquinone biosynthesis C-methylase UbiE